MVVYAETVFLNNFVIDAAILSASAKTVRAKKSIKRLLLGAGLGAVFACITPLIPFGGVPLFALKTAVGALVSKCGVKTRGGRRFLLSYALFFGYTFLLGGAVSGICGMLNQPFGGMEGALIVSLAYGAFRILLVAFNAGKKITAIPALYYEITLYAESGLKATGRGFLDTGNRMQKEGEPVFAVNARVFSALYQPGAKLAPYTVQTALGEGSCPLLRLGRAELVSQGKTQVLFGGYVLLTKTPFPLSGCEILLGADVIARAQSAENIQIAV